MSYDDWKLCPPEYDDEDPPEWYYIYEDALGSIHVESEWHDMEFDQAQSAIDNLNYIKSICDDAITEIDGAPTYLSPEEREWDATDAMLDIMRDREMEL